MDEIHKLARTIYAMATKKKQTDLSVSLKNERFQRTFTDELFSQKSRAGFREIEPAQKEAWLRLASRK